MNYAVEPILPEPKGPAACHVALGVAVAAALQLAGSTQQTVAVRRISDDTLVCTAWRGGHLQWGPLYPAGSRS